MSVVAFAKELLKGKRCEPANANPEDEEREKHALDGAATKGQETEVSSFLNLLGLCDFLINIYLTDSVPSRLFTYRACP
jgi:hypothetical protein